MCALQDVCRLSELCVESHGFLGKENLLPVPKISLICTYPATPVVPAKNIDMPGGVSHIATHPYVCVAGTPLNLVKQLASVNEPKKHEDVMTDRAGAASSAQRKRVVLEKGPSTFQSLHTDDDATSACADPNFCSYLAAITDDADVRVWDDSHDVVAELVNVERSSQFFTSEAFDQMPDRIQEASAASFLRAMAAPGSLIHRGEKIMAKIASIPRGSCMVFLASLAHAGAGMHRRATRINWRMHLYGLRPGKEFHQQQAAFIPARGLASMCEKSLGGDNDC